MSVVRLLYEIFYSDCTHYAEGYCDAQGKVGYTAVEGIPSLELIQQHVDGEKILGAYTVLPGDHVRWMAFDVDSKKLGLEGARELALKLCKFLGASQYILEYSGNKGYHIILIFKEKVLAKDARDVGNLILENLGLPKRGDPHVEVFPKQDELTDSNPLGNLLRLPLGKHPGTHNAAVFTVAESWDTVLDPEEELRNKRVNLEDLKALIKDHSPRDQVVRILLPYWNDGERHNMSLYTSGYLASLGWTEEDTADLITEIHEQGGAGTLKDQLGTVKSTFKKHYEGGRVLGFQGLSEVLSSKSLADLMNWAEQQTSSTVLQMIDRFRLEKDAAFKKVRKAARTVVTHFKEFGKLIADGQDIYWLNHKTKTLMLLDGPLWIRHAHNEFGLNVTDSFGRQTLESIRNYAAAEAKQIKVYKRAYWSGILLYVNLGGSEVYVLDGKSIRVIMNGDEDIMFLNQNDTLYVPNLLEDEDSPTLNVWAYLANDINFKVGSEVQALPEQQREMFKALVLSVFFAEIMATRPILTILADPSSGKTTTARRVLKLLEGPSEEVLGAVPDKPDSFRASLQAHRFLVLDNLEKTNAPWLPDMLNRVSTGTHIEIRKLHTTNEMYKIKPNCFIAITATLMPFSDETVYTRMLPLELDVIKSFRQETAIQAYLVDNLNGLWKGMLQCLNQVVAELVEHKEVEMPSQTRLADFSVFCARIKGAEFLNGDDLMQGLANLVNYQKQILESNSPLTDIINIWLQAKNREDSKSTEFYSASQLYTSWQRIAANNKMDFRFRSVQGLSRHLGVLESQLIQHYGMSVRVGRENGRDAKLYGFEKLQMLKMN